MIECVIGLGKDLFYNSSMESCLVFGSTKKSKDRKGKILFIDAKDLIKRENTQNFLTKEHIKKILGAYERFEDVERFAKVVTIKEVEDNDSNLNIRLYVPDMRYYNEELIKTPLKKYVDKFIESKNDLKKSTKEMNEMLKEVVK